MQNSTELNFAHTFLSRSASYNCSHNWLWAVLSWFMFVYACCKPFI